MCYGSALAILGYEKKCNILKLNMIPAARRLKKRPGGFTTEYRRVVRPEFSELALQDTG